MTMEIEEEALVKVTLRLPETLHQELADRAHATRLPLAVYLRALLSGTEPAPAPPPLSSEARALLRVLAHLASNLTQLTAHARQSGEPLARLAREDGELEQLQLGRDELAEAIELGSLEEGQILSALRALEGPAVLANALAARLNRNELALPSEWHAPLMGLMQALRPGAAVHG